MAVSATRVLLYYLGFTRAGISAGSYAARIMAMSRGGVGKGSPTAIMQSIGAAGLKSYATAAVAAAGAFVAMMIYSIIQYVNVCGPDYTCERAT